MFSALQPKEELNESDVQSGLRALTLQGTTGMGFDAITTGGFMAAYALSLGASNAQIGILAALPFIFQPLQIVSIALTEKIRKRKAIAVVTMIVANTIWLPAALIPFLIDAPGTLAISLLLAFIAIRSSITPFFNVPWLSWMRELVPASQRGAFFARRLRFATALGMSLGLGGAIFADYWRENANSDTAIAQGFAYPILGAALSLGVLTWVFILRMPERRMAPKPEGDQRSLISSVLEPLKDPSYKHLVRFKFVSTLAMHLAIPFFAVYMIQVIGLPVSAVMALTALSQLANILFLGPWGRMVDRFGAKPILSASVSLYFLVILGWAFTTLPDRYFLTIPLLVVLHVLAGIATAGMNVTHGTIAMKLAPDGKSTSYLAASSLSISMGAALGPLLGGLFADFFDTRSFRISFEFLNNGDVTSFSPFFLTGFDFLFAIAFLLGLTTLGVLALVKEEGEVDRNVVMDELMGPMRGLARPMSSVPGVSTLFNLPFETARRTSVPGLDVAVGVTAYQVGETARVATRAADATRNVAQRAGRETESLARQMLIGSLRSASALEEDATRVLGRTARTLMRGLGKSRRSSLDAAYGAGYGAVETAAASGLKPEEAAETIIEAAGEFAENMPDVNRYEAIAEVSMGVLDAVDDISKNSVEAVKEVTERLGQKE